MEANRKALMNDKYLTLWEVVSVKQACMMWGYHPNTIRLAIYDDKIAARKIDREWAISLRSMVDHYGPPIHDAFGGIYD